MKNLVIGLVIGAVAATYYWNKKHNVKNSQLNKTVDNIKKNISDYLKSTNAEGDPDKIAGDLVSQPISNHDSFGGNVNSKRYVLR